MFLSLSSLRRRAGLFCLSLACFALTGVVRAGDAPTFSDPEVTTFVKMYSEFADNYSANMKNYMATVKSGDTAKMQEAAKKMQADQTKSQEISAKSATVSGKIKPDEATKFSEFMTKCAQKMADSAKAQ